MSEPANGNGIWKYLTTAFGSIILTLLCVYFSAQKETVTKADLASALSAQQRQLDAQSAQLKTVQDSIVQLEINTGRMAEHLDVPKSVGSRQ